MTRTSRRVAQALLKIQGYRTLAANGLALAAVWLGVPEDALRQWAGEIVSALAFVNMALRFITQGPVGDAGLRSLSARLKNWIDRGGFVGVLALAALGTLSACALPWNDQEAAGITRAEVEFCRGESGEIYPCKFSFRDGKQKLAVRLELEGPGGWKVKYSARQVEAFEAQRIRAAVETAISEDVKTAFPGVVEMVLKAFAGGVP